jgi:hypothetical protein
MVTLSHGDHWNYKSNGSELIGVFSFYIGRTNVHSSDAFMTMVLVRVGV